MEDKKTSLNKKSTTNTKKRNIKNKNSKETVSKTKAQVKETVASSKVPEKDVKKKSKVEEFLNSKNDFKNYEIIIFAVLIIAASVFLTIVVTNETNIINTKTSKTTSVNSELSDFEEVYNLINNKYYKKTDKSKLIEGAINGMLDSLEDPHTSYFNLTETEQFNEVMNGSYEGIGAEISLDDDKNIIVFSVFKNSPAAEVGLKHGDIITEVNGKSTKGLSTTETVALIKDPTKPVANIKINRDGKTLEFNIKKRIVEIESIESKVYNINNKKIGYIAINNFANNTYDQFKENLEKLEEKNISGLVIDVRNNTGGYLHSVTSILNILLPNGKVMYQIQDNKSTQKYKSTSNESRNYPIAVLTNKSSASASEILAISLKESIGSDVVGTYSYGKGTVQTTKELSNGAMIKYTVQKWLSPKGNWINEKGVEPTVEIELDESYSKNPVEDNDNQLQKALDVVSKK